MKIYTLIVVALIVLAGISIIIKESYNRGYKDACKGFYQGKFSYDLVDNPDGTRTWQKIENKKGKKGK